MSQVLLRLVLVVSCFAVAASPLRASGYEWFENCRTSCSSSFLSGCAEEANCIQACIKDRTLTCLLNAGSNYTAKTACTAAGIDATALNQAAINECTEW